jgi:hypothetical protein
MADPVSWFVIKRGWDVVGSDGAKLGTVEETIGDSQLDIFDGLTVGTGVLGRPKYVPAELVDEIVEGTISLSVGSDGFEKLEPYREPRANGTTRPE